LASRGYRRCLLRVCRTLLPSLRLPAAAAQVSYSSLTFVTGCAVWRRLFHHERVLFKVLLLPFVTRGFLLLRWRQFCLAYRCLMGLSSGSCSTICLVNVTGSALTVAPSVAASRFAAPRLPSPLPSYSLSLPHAVPFLCWPRRFSSCAFHVGFRDAGRAGGVRRRKQTGETSRVDAILQRYHVHERRFGRVRGGFYVVWFKRCGGFRARAFQSTNIARGASAAILLRATPHADAPFPRFAAHAFPLAAGLTSHTVLDSLPAGGGGAVTRDLACGSSRRNDMTCRALPSLFTSPADMLFFTVHLSLFFPSCTCSPDVYRYAAAYREQPLVYLSACRYSSAGSAIRYIGSGEHRSWGWAYLSAGGGNARTRPRARISP